jgi:hypothetical protein
MVITKLEVATFIIAICFVLFLLFGFNWVA